MEHKRYGPKADVTMIHKGELAYFEIIADGYRTTYYQPDLNDISRMCTDAGIDFFRVKEIIDARHEDVFAIVIDKEKFESGA